mgnify:CR=1 FL=1
MPSIRSCQAAYALAMNRYVKALQALDGPGPVNQPHREEAIDAQRDLRAAGEELIAMDVRTVDDALEAIDALRFALQTMEMFPQPADHIAAKIAAAVHVLVLDAMARHQKRATEGAR